MEIEKHLEMLGKAATDKVTGFKGIIVTVAFDLYGCLQVIVDPKTNKDGKKEDSRWFDVSRLKIGKAKPVMPLPDFTNTYLADVGKGPSFKPDLYK